MIEIREASPEDKDGWNEVATNSPSATYAHTWEWKEIIKNGLENKPICLVAEDNQKIIGIYSGFLKKTESRNFLVKGKFVFFSPLTTTWDYGGPLILPGISSECIKFLVLSMQKKAKGMKAISIRLSPYPTSNYFTILDEMGYRKRERQTIFIDLKKSEEELWADLNKKTRNQVRQSQKKNLMVRETTNINFLYNCLEDTSQRTGMKLPPKHFFEEILNHFGHQDMVKIHEVDKDGTPIGASLCFHYKKYMVTRYYTALSEFLKERPYHALIWHIITEAKSNGFEVCDVGGIPADIHHGIYRFKKGWGGNIVDVDWYVKDLYLSRTRTLKRRISRRA